MTALHDVSGRCLCGAVSFTAKIGSHNVDVCHCDMCRRWTGGPFLALAQGGATSFEGAENIGVYKSSEWGERAFCKICGTSLYWRLIGSNEYAVSAGTLDDQSKLALTTEIFIDEKPAYYTFANETKRLTGAEAMAALLAGKDTGQG
jgi:hypothetical protein